MTDGLAGARLPLPGRRIDAVFLNRELPRHRSGSGPLVIHVGALRTLAHPLFVAVRGISRLKVTSLLRRGIRAPSDAGAGSRSVPSVALQRERIRGAGCYIALTEKPEDI